MFLLSRVFFFFFFIPWQSSQEKWFCEEAEGEKAGVKSLGESLGKKKSKKPRDPERMRMKMWRGFRGEKSLGWGWNGHGEEQDSRATAIPRKTWAGVWE